LYVQRFGRTAAQAKIREYELRNSMEKSGDSAAALGAADMAA